MTLSKIKAEGGGPWQTVLMSEEPVTGTEGHGWKALVSVLVCLGISFRKDYNKTLFFPIRVLDIP